ncbi:MAG TPA: S41 family peptidase [Syntrophomonadaceae bacterium]|nr:S41 family peptidase [Syntrophomonadaceae bacterium]HPR94674.1 S41 family peptidase [Syntrophomonadaceae bacterium]
MKLKNEFKLGVVLVAILVISGLFSAEAIAADQDAEAVREILRQNYVTELSDAQLRGDSAEEIIKNLNDPYTTIFTEEDFSAFTESIDGRYQGIGIVLVEKEGYVEIVSVLDASPGQKAGLQPRDLIIAVDDIDIAGRPQEQVVKFIRGEPGTEVNLKVKRQDKILQITVTREAISLPVVSSEMLKNHILYIYISSFATNTAELVGQELDKHPDTEGIILDLRDNGGGYVQAALALGSEFLDPGTMFWLQNRDGKQAIDVDGSNEYKQPIVLLVNEGTASAAEVIAGAFQDEERAVLIGETTFGKLCMQSAVSLGNGQVFKFTTHYLLTPAQRMLNKTGIEPDIPADEQDALAIAERLANDQQLMKDNYRYLLTVDLNGLTAYINAEKAFDGKLLLKNNLLYLNLRDVASEIGLSVWWDAKINKVMVRKDVQTTEIGIDNGQAFIEDGKTYVSIRELARIMGGYAGYQSSSKLVSLQWN